MRQRDLIFPALALAVTLIGTIAFIFWGNELYAYLQDDVFKLLAQLILITGIGGLGSFIVTEYTRSRERRQQRRELLRKAYSDILESYNEVKRIRRHLRAKALRIGPSGDKDLVDRDSYDDLMMKLNDMQLQWEFYKNYANSNPDLYGAASHDVYTNLKQAEQYLGKMVSEWEEKLATFTEEPASKPISELTTLSEFISHKSDNFKKEIADPIHKALSEISKEITS